jgi:ketosteroid isomerase-like protein
MATTEQTAAVDVVKDYFAALNRHDVTAAKQYLDPEVVEEISSVGVLRGPDEVGRFFDGLMKAVPDLELIVEGTTSEGDRVAIQWRMQGNFTGGPLFNGVQPTGGRVTMRGCDVIEVSGGRIVRNTAYQDGLELARSLGMMPPQDSAAERAMIGAFNGATKLRQAVRDRFGG